MAAALLGRLRDPRRLRVRCLFACIAAVSGCGESATEAAGRLLGVDPAGLAPAEAAELERIVAEWFPPGADGTGFLDSNCGEVNPAADVVDLNGDGAGEVFVEWGNACTSGMTGRSLSLFLRDDTGAFRDQFGFPASGYRLIGPGRDGYPDIELGGPGFCFPVWSWQGEAYAFDCSLPQEGGDCPADRKVCAER